MRFDLQQALDDIDNFEVYTTRPDTLMGISYLSLAAEHPIALQLAQSNPALKAFIEECKSSSVAEADMATMEKKGLDTGIKALHPISGEPIAVWVANYVLMDYGSGAVMAVPAHDERDFEFAKQYNIEIKQVIKPKDGTEVNVQEQAYTEKGILSNSGQFDGLDFDAAFKAIAKALEENNKGRITTNFRLRDWGVSRQRYWGTPVPMLNLLSGGEIPVPADRLPVCLPEDVEMDGVQSPIKADPQWRQTEAVNGQACEHETDTFDTFMESSWYYARFTCPDFENGMLDPKQADYWLPVDQYVGGIEHAILHLLYSRFFHKLMRDEGLLSSDEPYKSLLCQGMVCAESYYQVDQGKKTYFTPAEVEVEKDEKGAVIHARLKTDGSEVIVGGVEKMSKSKNNGVDPQSMIDRYGADTVRLFMMFAAPPEQSLEWSDNAVAGSHKFLNKLWRLVYQHHEQHQNTDFTTLQPEQLNDSEQSLRRKVHQTISKVSDDYGRRLTFNTAIAAVMELTNDIGRFKANSEQAAAVLNEAIETCILLLSPIVPHIAHELWLALGHTQSVDTTPWPTVDETALVESNIQMVVQVNGKVRAKLTVAANADSAEILAQAKADENVQKFLADKEIKMEKVIPGKLVTIAVK